MNYYIKGERANTIGSNGFQFFSPIALSCVKIRKNHGVMIMYVLKDLDNNQYFGGAFVGWIDKKKEAIKYDNDIANEGVSYWKSVGRNVAKVRA